MDSRRPETDVRPRGLTRRHFLGVAAAGLALSACSASPRREPATEVAVYGGTPSGVIAAVTASRLGARTVLVLGESPLGGMMSNGLGYSDLPDPRILGGWTKSFFEQVGASYSADHPMYTFSPSVAEGVFRTMLAEAKVSVRSGVARRVETSGSRLDRIQLDDGSTIEAGNYVDASYEGALLELAALPFTHGREASSRYGESLAGFGSSIRPEPTTSDARTLPQSFAGPAPSNVTHGAGDSKTMAYSYRLCLTRDQSRGTPFEKPAGYDADYYQAIVPYVTAAGTIDVKPLPRDKYDLNNGPNLMTDLINGSWSFPTLTSPTDRLAVANTHKQWLQGLLYHLSNDARAPEQVADDLRRYRLAADEFVDNANWPRQLYVRLSRRLVGRYVMTQRDIEHGTDRTDAIAHCSYAMDSHAVQRFQEHDGAVVREGVLATSSVRPRYAVPWDALRPADPDSNIVTSVCVSASNVAACSLRVEPHYMLFGEAAGAAAHVASNGNTVTGRISADEVRSALGSGGSVIHPPW